MVTRYDGDTVSAKAVYTREANGDAQRQVDSPSYILDAAGKTMCELEKDFLLTQYMLTFVDGTRVDTDCNKEAPKYSVA